MNRLLLILALLLAPLTASVAVAAGEGGALRENIAEAQSKVVKIFGAGGLRGLEAYQSGMLISDTGHVLTAWSYVLDCDSITVVLDDGRKFEAKLVGADPRLEVAVLKFEATDLPHFNLAKAVDGRVGTRVLAMSNLYRVASGDEQASLQHGVIAARSTLSARHGVFSTPYHGPVYVLDAMTNNPGAPGGAVTDIHGQLLGIIGKELRDARTNIWLNYAIPISQLRGAVDDILAGRARPSAVENAQKAQHPLDLAALGLLLVPNLVDSTPPYVEAVRADSPASRAGLIPDDLVLFVDDRLIHSLRDLKDACQMIEAGGRLHLTVRRGEDLKVIEVDGTEQETKKP